MNILQWFIVIQFILLPVRLAAQPVQWENFSFGAAAGYSFTEKDLHEYWGDYPSAGLVINYKLTDQFFLEGIISLAYLKDANSIPDRIPDIFLINQFGGLKIVFPLIGDLYLFITPALTNTTMIFKGKASERAGDNFVESEFGISLSTGAAVISFNKLKIESCFGYQNIFTSPETLNLFHLGIKFIWN